MIKGIMLFESGGAQQIGELTSLSNIIATIQQILPELEEKESQRVFDSISDEQLQQIVASRKIKTGKTERLEP